MNRRNFGGISVAVVVVIAIAAIAWYNAHASRQLRNASQAPIVGKAQVGQPAPPFSVATTDGSFDLHAVNKPVFLEIFATWCPHCQRETATIDRLYRKYRSRMAFLAVSGSDTAMDGVTASSQMDVLAFVSRFNVQYPVAYDATLKIAGSYLQGAYPTLCIIGRDKKVKYLTTGEVSYDDLAAQIEKVL